MDDNFSPFHPFDNMQFNEFQCFLCGKFLYEDNGTKEHVFPRWLLHQFDLFNQKLELSNGTSIPYRQVTIPCCNECNNIYLSQIESMMESAIKQGIDALRIVDPLTIYVWIGKIFYGLLFRDLSLLAYRQDPVSGYLMDKREMENYRALHGFLQSARMEIKYVGFFPGSIFVFDVNLPESFPLFDYSDNPIGMTVRIRIGNIGIIACLKDNGMIYKSFENQYKKTFNKRLEPIQFDELCGIVFYHGYTMERSHTFIGVSPPDDSSLILNVPGFSLKPYFPEMDLSLLARFLEKFWHEYGITYEEIYQPPRIMTFLHKFDV